MFRSTRYVSLFFSVFLILCACGETMKQYKKDEVEIISVQQNISGGTEILYRPMLDSMYYCPGITIHNDNQRNKISFVRCGLKEKCQVDVLAENVGLGQWRVIVPFMPARIGFTFSDGETSL